SLFFFSSRRRHTRSKRDWSSDVCSSDVTIDEIIRRDDKLKEKISIDEDVHAYNDPGFILGIIITFVGILTDFGTFSTILMFSGIAIIVFYQDALHVLKRIIQDFRRVTKNTP